MWRVCNELLFWVPLDVKFSARPHASLHTNSTGHYSSGCYRAQPFIPTLALWECTGVCRWCTRKTAFPRTEGSNLLSFFQRHQNAAFRIMTAWKPVNTYIIKASRHFSMHLNGMCEGLIWTSLIIFSRAKLLLDFILFFTNLPTNESFMEIKGCH